MLNGTVSYGSDASTGIIIRIDNAIDLHNRTTLDVGSGTARQNGAIGETGGSFGFTKTGAGTLTLFGANTYTGGTTVAAGILRIGTGGALGSGVMAFTGDGAFGVDSTRALTNNISIGNGVSGTLGAASGQTLTLNGASLVVGTGSTIRFGSSADRGTVVLAQAAVTVAAGGTFEVVRGILQAGSPGLLSSFTSHAAATKVGTGATLDLNGFATVVNNLSGNGTVATGGGALSLSGTGNFSGVINGAGTLSFSGATVLTGTSTYTGASTLGGGTLSVDGSIASSNLTVNSGGTLGGNGTVGNTAINAGAALAPGNSIGLLTVQGNLAFASASSYMVEVSPANADRVNVTGLATLGGAAIKPSFAAGAYVGKQYTILHADGGVSGTFGTEIDTNLPANFHTALSYDANNAYLNLILTFGIPGGLNVSQQNVGDALTNFFNSTGGIPAAFASLSAANLTQVSGQSATGAQQATFGAMNLFMGLISDPFIEGRGETAAGAAAFASEHDGANAYAASTRPRSGSERDAYAAMHRKAPLVETLAQRWSVWAAGFGGSQTTDGNAALGSNSATSRVFGTAAGADYRFSPRTIGGFALAGGGTTFSVANGGWGRSDLFQAGAFIRHTAGSAYLSGALAYGWQDITADRTLTVDGIDRLRAEFKANAVSGRAEGGYRFIAPVAGGVLGVTPYAAAQVTSFGLPAYAESVISGAGTFALAYGSRSVTDTRSELGLRTDKSYAMPNALLTLRSRVAWSHDYNPDRSIAATFQTLPGASFVVNGASQAPDAALTTGSAELKWMNGWSATATFEGEFSHVTRSYAGKGAVRYAW